jgi:hypothetical protein
MLANLFVCYAVESGEIYSKCQAAGVFAFVPNRIKTGDQ